MPGRRIRLQDADLRRAQILDETIRIIGTRGYHGFTLQEVAQCCGLTNGGVLYHFASKEQLLLAALQEHDRRLSTEMVQALSPKMQEMHKSLSLQDTVEMLHNIVQRANAHPELSRLYTVLEAEALDPAHPAHYYFATREAMALEGFAILVAPHVADPPAVARQLHALMDGLTLQWHRAEHKFDLVAAWDKAVANIAWREPKKKQEKTK